MAKTDDSFDGTEDLNEARVSQPHRFEAEAPEPVYIDCAPHVPGLLAWLACMYETQPAYAIRVIRAGWPSLTHKEAIGILTGELEIAAVLTPKGQTEETRSRAALGGAK